MGENRRIRVRLGVKNRLSLAPSWFSFVFSAFLFFFSFSVLVYFLFDSIYIIDIYIEYSILYYYEYSYLYLCSYIVNVEEVWVRDQKTLST